MKQNRFSLFIQPIVNFIFMGRRIRKLSYDFNKFNKKYKKEIKKQNVIFFYKRIAFSSTESLIENSNREKKITVSLTSYGGRIDDVYLVIESLGLQTVKADRIVLWLSKDEFSPETIPIMLKRMEKRGLVIGYCEDLRSYKKIIPSLGKYPNDLIITADDDILYPEYMIEKLYKEYLKEPNIIHCHRGHRILFNEKGDLKPYRKWERDSFVLEKSLLIFPTSGGGVLYYPGCFPEEVANSELFMELCPTADDIWLKVMTLNKGIKCKIINSSRKWSDDNIDITVSNDIGLYGINKYQNDEQMKNVFEYFKIKDLKD